MSENTFYYTLSTMPQVLAAISAILAVFLFRRLETIKQQLIGDGTSILDRSKLGEYDFIFEKNAEARIEKKKQDLRLRDAINRKNIGEIKNVILFYSNQENNAEKNEIPINKERGLQYVYGKFSEIEGHYNSIIVLSRRTFIVSIISILLSVICLSFANFIFSHCILDFTILINLIVFIISIFLTVIVVIKSF